MRRLFNAATAVLVAISTITLSACGPDDGTSPGAGQNSAAADAGTPPVTQSATPATPPAPPFGASATLSNAPGNASDSAVQNVEASLASDSQQVPPVMHFAPGDSDQNSSRN